VEGGGILIIDGCSGWRWVWSCGMAGGGCLMDPSDLRKKKEII
jgi:hypothetical protein